MQNSEKIIADCTLFACPKPFTGKNGKNQRNAVANWRQLGLPVILLGNEDGVAEIAKEFGCFHLPDIAQNEHGTPYLDDIFTQAQDFATTPYMLYANADIIFPRSLPETLRHVRRLWDEFMIIGQRWDTDITDELFYSDQSFEKFEQLRLSRGKLHSPWGVDYFIFPHTLNIKMPHYLLGRPKWDLWLVWTMKQKGIPLINATKGMPVIHQNHDYTHIHDGNGKDWKGSEADANEALCQSIAPEIDGVNASVFCAEWAFTGNSVVRDESPERAAWYAQK